MYIKIRWAGLIPILAVSYFSRTLMWYFLFYYPLTEMFILYFFGTEDEKNRASADIFNNIKGIMIAVIVLIVILVPYCIHHSRWMNAQFNKISASVNNSHRSAQPFRWRRYKKFGSCRKSLRAVWAHSTVSIKGATKMPKSSFVQVWVRRCQCQNSIKNIFVQDKTPSLKEYIKLNTQTAK